MQINVLSERLKYRNDLLVQGLSNIQIETKHSFEKKINEKIYNFEDCDCFCGYRNDILLADRDWFGLYYPIVICKECGLIRANPRLDFLSYKEFYDNEYRKLYGEGDVEKNILWEQKVAQGQGVFDYIIPKLPSNIKVVYEIGCNMGSTLSVFKTENFEVAGVDFGSENIEYGRRISGIDDLFVGGIPELLKKKSEKSADLVILNHVFEHLLDLEKELLDIRSLLRPGGYLFISVPGTFWWIKNICKDNILGLLQNAHTFQFSLASLSYVLNCAGFEMVSGDETIRAIFRMDQKFRKRGSPPKNEYSRIIRYFKQEEAKYAFRLAVLNGIKNLLRKIKMYNYCKQLKEKMANLHNLF
ncbi:MAG: class I SAM-dependent methyltransferase [Candidatus Omnitrophica bacterium]|nr:class I SAM-dependent methyltransferase [Candidatus Omnitrophota bacterium]